MVTRTIGLVLSSALAGATSAGAAPTAEEQVRALEQKWVDAEIHRDAAALRRILDEKFIATFEAGAPLDRDAFIRAIVSGKSTDVTQALSDSIVRVDGDTAVVAGIDTVRGKAKEVPYVHAYRYTATYIRRGGRWVALAEHMVRVPPAK
jgi:ketosteroid isomerase-like protein